MEVDTERIDDLMDEDGSESETDVDDEVINATCASTSASASASTEVSYQRRTLMTPSPIGVESSDAEVEEGEQKVSSKKKKDVQKSRKRKQAPSPAPAQRISEPQSKRVSSARSNAATAKTRAKTSQREGSSEADSGDDNDASVNKRAKRKMPPPSNEHKNKKLKTDSVSGNRSQSRTQGQACTSQSQSQPNLNRLRTVSHPGVIKSLRLQNFMCHSDFVHHFHPNLNFITGQNGSGKSALLSGILIALGGKAAVTCRTNSLKSLIQKGKSTCRVSVTLVNRNGLKKYGEEITVERWINISGGAGYRIKSSGGQADANQSNPNQWRQLKKPELDNIMLGLNIQIDNPVAILNQEVARSFLRSKDPKVKFKLFYEGTLLGKLEVIGEETLKQIEETDEILANQAEVIKAIGADVQKLRIKCQKIEELNHIKNKMSKLQHEYLWSLVIEQEKKCDGIKRSIVRFDKEIEALSSKLAETEAAFANQNEESLATKQAEVRQKLEEVKQELEQLRKELNGVKNSTTSLRMTCRAAVSTITSKQAQIDKIVAQIERVKADQDVKDKEESNREQEKLCELQTQRSNLEAVLNSIKGDADNFQTAADKEHEKLESSEADAKALTVQIDAKKRSIAALSKNANKYAVFGPQMEQLMAKIQANIHKFKKPPRGPLGACFRVRQPEYTVLVEGILYNTLTSFIVDNAQDLNLLRGYVNSVYKEGGPSQRSGRASTGVTTKVPGIMMMAYADRMHNIAQNLAKHPKGVSLFELLEVDNDFHVVTNALIDIAEVEKIVLFKDDSTACQVLKNASSCPRALKNAYTLNWFKFTPAPHFAARVMGKKARVEVLSSGRSREAEIMGIKSEIKDIENELRNMEPQRAKIREQEKSFRLTYQEKVNELSTIRRQMGEIGNEIKRQQNKISQRERRCDLTSYYEEVDELREDVANQTTIRDNAVKEYDVIKPRLVQLENKRKELEGQVEELSEEQAGFQEAREKLKAKQKEADHIMNKMRAKITSLEADKKSVGKDLESKTRTLEEKQKSAIDAGAEERVETSKTPGELKDEFESLKVRVRETEAQLGNHQELERQLHDRQKQYKAHLRDYAPLNKMHKLLYNMCESQKKSFETTRTQMGRTLTLFFSAMAKQRGYEGRLLLDFKTKELYYFVCPDGHSFNKTLKAIDAQQAHAGKRTAEQNHQNKILKKTLVEYSLGLSGGERSFATICFIMALWQVMECPFYMLDEFDVFMDAFNRKASQTALTAHAKKFNMNQFILFTPLDIRDVPGPEDASLLRLYPPVRKSVPKGQHGRSGVATAGSGSQARNGGDDDNEDTRPAGGRNSDSSVENIDPRSDERVRSQKNGAGSVRSGRTQRQRQVVKEV